VPGPATLARVFALLDRIPEGERDSERELFDFLPDQAQRSGKEYLGKPRSVVTLMVEMLRQAITHAVPLEKIRSSTSMVPRDVLDAYDRSDQIVEVAGFEAVSGDGDTGLDTRGRDLGEQGATLADGVEEEVEVIGGRLLQDLGQDLGPVRVCAGHEELPSDGVVLVELAAGAGHLGVGRLLCGGLASWLGGVEVAGREQGGLVAGESLPQFGEAWSGLRRDPGEGRDAEVLYLRVALLRGSLQPDAVVGVWLASGVMVQPLECLRRGGGVEGLHGPPGRASPGWVAVLGKVNAVAASSGWARIRRGWTEVMPRRRKGRRHTPTWARRRRTRSAAARSTRPASIPSR
jgi:hypothetical protein